MENREGEFREREAIIRELRKTKKVVLLKASSGSTGWGLPVEMV
jgi:hypothetical protein